MSRRPRNRKKHRIKARLPAPHGRIRVKPPPLEVHPSRGWEEISYIYGYRPGARPKKLKLCADNDVPQELLDTIRDDDIPVESARDAGLDSAGDDRISAWARRRKRILLTFNHRDFWNDAKHPLQNSPGMIVMAIRNSHVSEAALALAILYESFARHFTLDWWSGVKVRVFKREYIIRTIMQGRVIQYKVKYVGGRFFFKEH